MFERRRCIRCEKRPRGAWSARELDLAPTLRWFCGECGERFLKTALEQRGEVRGQLPLFACSKKGPPEGDAQPVAAKRRARVFQK